MSGWGGRCTCRAFSITVRNLRRCRYLRGRLQARGRGRWRELSVKFAGSRVITIIPVIWHPAGGVT